MPTLRYEIDIETTATRFRVDERQCRAIIGVVLQRLKYTEVGMSVRFVSHQKMVAYNKKTFRHNRSTDVISFPWESDMFDGMEYYLGDIIICLDQVYAQAQNFSVTCQNELCRVVIHGMLHLMGYEDTSAEKKKTMFELQESLVTYCVEQGLIVKKLMSERKR